MTIRRITHRAGKMSEGAGAIVRPSKGTVAVGTGFVALDIVINGMRGSTPRTMAGGSCGNVLAILAYLGWDAYPVATIGQDVAAERLVADLKSVGVNPRFVQRAPSRRTPIVIERIRLDANGVPQSRYLWTCPECASWMPSYQPVVARDMESVAASMPEPKVFFFDRVSRGALDLAHAALERGALIVFEPSSARDEKSFREAVTLCHVLKYSHERLPGGPKLGDVEPLLQIETLGADGLRYRIRRRGKRLSWRSLKSCHVSIMRDTVGSGDWCTAGLLHAIGRDGAEGLVNATMRDIERALKLGQALAALNCSFESARGGMYALDKTAFRTTVASILAGKVASIPNDQNLAFEKPPWGAVCPSCKQRIPALASA
jgi:sugar/nucleoside kinase (ribokinase family)